MSDEIDVMAVMLRIPRCVHGSGSSMSFGPFLNEADAAEFCLKARSWIFDSGVEGTELVMSPMNGPEDGLLAMPILLGMEVET